MIIQVIIKMLLLLVKMKYYYEKDEEENYGILLIIAPIIIALHPLDTHKFYEFYLSIIFVSFLNTNNMRDGNRGRI